MAATQENPYLGMTIIRVESPDASRARQLQLRVLQGLGRRSALGHLGFIGKTLARHTRQAGFFKIIFGWATVPHGRYHT